MKFDSTTIDYIINKTQFIEFKRDCYLTFIFLTNNKKKLKITLINVQKNIKNPKKYSTQLDQTCFKAYNQSRTKSFKNFVTQFLRAYDRNAYWIIEKNDKFKQVLWFQNQQDQEKLKKGNLKGHKFILKRQQDKIYFYPNYRIIMDVNYLSQQIQLRVNKFNPNFTTYICNIDESYLKFNNSKNQNFGQLDISLTWAFENLNINAAILQFNLNQNIIRWSQNKYHQQKFYKYHLLSNYLQFYQVDNDYQLDNSFQDDITSQSDQSVQADLKIESNNFLLNEQQKLVQSRQTQHLKRSFLYGNYQIQLEF